MAKGQTQQATNASNSLINKAGTETQPIVSGLESRYPMDQGTADLYGSTAAGAYGEDLTTGGYDPGQLPALRANTANLAATGGYDPGQLSDI
jgi:hypothetical protein